MSTVTLEATPQPVPAPATAAPAPAPQPFKSRLLELVIDRTQKDGAAPQQLADAWLDEFLATDSVPRALDLWLGTKPWLMVAFFFLGSAAGILNVWRTMEKMARETDGDQGR